MTSTTRRLIASWIVGSLVGTAIIAATSPLFVRSYVPLHADSLRGVWTLPPAATYRWRSEGYADTSIGPLGMPGKVETPPRRPGTVRVALWGDSQAEGVCVGDPEKLFAQAQAISGERLEIFPLARSGEDAADWLTQMPKVERALDLDFHVILVVDLHDLLTASEAPLPPPSPSDVEAAKASIAATLPAFVIQAARHLLTEADETTPRRLRFRLGPVEGETTSGTTAVPVGTADPVTAAAAVRGQPSESSATSDGGDDSRRQLWRREIDAIDASTSLPVLILHAPVSPQIIDGRIVTETDDPSEFADMKSAADRAGLLVASTQRELMLSASEGDWPHGFHNGYIGSGHLNRTGNAVVARVLVKELFNALEAIREDPSGEVPSGEGN